MQEQETAENQIKDPLLSEKKSNLFFIITSILLFIFSVFLGYKFLDQTGIINHQTEISKPQNVQQLIQVEVLNGCGIPGVGNYLTDFLRQKGIDVVKTGNYRSFDIDKTFIVDRMGKVETAYQVADSLNLDKKLVISEVNKNLFIDMTIVIGKDYKNYFQKSGS